jgi:imidazolonepropionase-like amidohydrolase
MSRAGMNFEQILSLTTSPAERFGYLNHSGRIAKGMDADLVVLRGDPKQDVTSSSKVRYTIGLGKIERSSILRNEILPSFPSPD